MGTLFFIVQLLCWAGLGVFNLWIWQKGKAQANLLMMIGGFVCALGALLFLFKMVSSLPGYLMIGGIAVFTYGFFLSVKPQIQANINELKNKAKSVADNVSGDDD